MDGSGRAPQLLVAASTVVAWSTLLATVVGLLAIALRPADDRYLGAAFAIVGLFGAVAASALGTLVGGIGLALAQWKDVQRRPLTLAFTLNLVALLGVLAYLDSL